MSAEQRRISVQIGTSMKNNFVVSQSDLWDTHTLSHAKQHSRQSPRNHATSQRCQEHSHMIGSHERNAGSQTALHMQRSVSEKNRTKVRHSKSKEKNICQSETDSEREPSIICGQSNKKLIKSIQHSHHHSTPNVAPTDLKRRQYHRKNDPSMYETYSESELLEGSGDTAILPIFRKLLTDKEPRYRSRNNVIGASCPNISIKCDIVEYL